jgi:membrane protein required for colicin V production
MPSSSRSEPVQWLPLGWVDVAMLAIVVVSALAGLLRGITAELLSLAGWFVAYFGARWFGPWVATWLPIGAAGSALNLGAAFVLAFVGVLVIWELPVRAASALIAATPLRPLDRLLGAVFGLVRGLLVLLVVATVIAYTPLAQTPAWRQSTVAALLEGALQALLPMLHAAPAGRSA